MLTVRSLVYRANLVLAAALLIGLWSVAACARPAAPVSETVGGLPQVSQGVSQALSAPVEASAPPASAHQQTKPNIIIITVDTMRSDALGAYGNSRARTPNMDALAREGTAFTMAFSPVPQTNPTHASIFTGDFPHRHGLFHHMASLLSPSVKPIAEILSEEGYNTAGHYSWVSFDPPSSGLERGFATYERHTIDRPWPPGQKFDWHEQLFDSRADVTTDAVLGWLEGAQDAPFFLWVHYNDLHFPYDPRPPFDTMFDPCESCMDGSIESITRIVEGYTPTAQERAHLRGLYDGEAAFTDQEIGRLFDWLRNKGILDQTIIVLTADHGESFGEKGLWSHQSILYNTGIRVPLIFRYPGVVPPGTVEALASSTDIMPTVLDLINVPLPAPVEGTSLLPLILGQEDGGDRIVFSQLWDGEKFAVVYQGMKLIKDRATGALELYDMTQDPAENDNLVQARPDISGDLEQRLDAWATGQGIIP